MVDQGSEISSGGDKTPLPSESAMDFRPPIDSTPVTITNQKLNGANYLAWSRAVELFIKGRRKKEYLSEKMEPPNETSDKYAVWEAENSMIMSWLLGSMTPDVSNTFMMYQTAAEIWTATKEMFSKRDNISELYELEVVQKDLKQGDQTVSKFFSNLSQIWQQIDSLESYKWTCNTDEKLFRTIRDTKRVFGFLSGLHKDFDPVRSRTLGTKPLPPINVVFSEVRQEESRLKVMMGSNQSSVTESSALVSQTSNTDKNKSVSFASKKIGNSEYLKKYCKFCHKVGHVVEECYRCPGSKVKPPPFWNNRQNNKSRQNSSGHSDANGSWWTDGDSWKSSPKAAVAESSQADSQELTFTPAQLSAVLRVLESERAQVSNEQIRATMASTGENLEGDGYEGEDWQC